MNLHPKDIVEVEVQSGIIKTCKVKSVVSAHQAVVLFIEDGKEAIISVSFSGPFPRLAKPFSNIKSSQSITTHPNIRDAKKNSTKWANNVKNGRKTSVKRKSRSHQRKPKIIQKGALGQEFKILLDKAGAQAMKLKSDSQHKLTLFEAKRLEEMLSPQFKLDFKEDIVDNYLIDMLIVVIKECYDPVKDINRLPAYPHLVDLLQARFQQLKRYILSPHLYDLDLEPLKRKILVEKVKQFTVNPMI